MMPVMMPAMVMMVPMVRHLLSDDEANHRVVGRSTPAQR